jgi:aminoglycoside phosphotransferase (APT) family kinase protein
MVTTPTASALAARLLDHLRAAVGEPRLGYAEPLTAISGGYDTRIFAFRLSGAPAPFAIPLILRVLGLQYPPARALRERATQNAVAALGYPAPRVLLASADPAILGGPFLVMERLPGRPLLDAQRLGIASVLVEMQLRLHALDAEVLLQALERDGVPRSAITLEGHLDGLERRIASGLEGLKPAMRWLSDRPPPADGRRVICHGDFHPQNILVAAGRVTGVIDWPNVVVADPAYDVASTRVILGLVPVGLMRVPPALRLIVDLARRILVGRYVAGYRRRRPLDGARLGYHEALACLRHLVRTVEARLAPVGESGLNPLDASAFGERLAARFARLTGVTPTLPPVPR